MIKYQIHIAHRAQRDYKKLPSQIKPRISHAILQLETIRRPPQSKHLSGKNLAQFRLRLGDYRILYDIYDQDKTILILRLGHRKDIYR